LRRYRKIGDGRSRQIHMWRFGRDVRGLEGERFGKIWGTHMEIWRRQRDLKGVQKHPKRFMEYI
jgi:hypothetical protein